MVYSEKYLSQFIFAPYGHVLSERIEDLVFNSKSQIISLKTQLCLGEFKTEQNYWLKIGKNYTGQKYVSIYTVFNKSTITLCPFLKMLLLITEIFIKFMELILKIIIF